MDIMMILWYIALGLWGLMLILRIILDFLVENSSYSSGMISKRVMYVGGTWGDSICYMNDNHTKIYGFKNRLFHSFAEGSVLFDIVNYKYEDIIPLYLITNIEYKDDPGDMFCADITLLGNVENPKPDGDYSTIWYKPYLGKLIEKYKNELNEVSFFKRKRKKYLTHIINTLEGMMK